MKKGIHFVFILMIIVMGFAVYTNSLQGKFIWDDEYIVENNVFIKNFSNLGKIFSNDIGAGGAQKFGAYRPLQISTYTLDYALWRLNEFGYHLTNIILHILTALCVYWLINLLYRNSLLSFLTGALFAIHPVHTEAISYISGRADPLAALFTLLCLVLYIKQSSLNRKNVYALIILTWVLALLSRENSLILPILILFYHYSFKTKVRIKEFMSISIIAVIYIILRAAVLKSTLVTNVIKTNFLQRLPGFFAAFIDYLRLLLFPFNLHMEYGSGIFNFSEPKVILGTAFFMILAAYLIKLRKSRTLIFFSLGWFIIMLLPHSNIFPINAYMAEHWLYLPSIGFFLILSSGIVYLYNKKQARAIAVLLAVFLFIFYGYLTIKQNSYWSKPFTFYARTLKFAPHSPRILTQLGTEYKETGKTEDAIVYYKKALEIRPDYVYAYNNLGLIYKDAGKMDEALAMFNKAAEANPGQVEVYNNLGYLYKDTGKNEEAIVMFKKAIKTDPNFVDAYYNLGVVYKDLGRREEAAKLFEKAVEMNPDNAEALNNLAGMYLAAGKKQEAMRLLQESTKANPNFIEAKKNLENLKN